ncbi:hypothetical protein OC845_006615, partial [Tilletia horrida]
SQTGGFGATQAQNNTGTTAGWSFGAANNAAKPGGLFSNTTTAHTATGAFGSGATSGAAATQTKPAVSFGNAVALTSAPNAFGSNMTAAAGGGLFGTSTAGFNAGKTTAIPATSGEIFGAGTSFGAKPATGGLFGSNQAQSAGTTGGSLYGASTAASTSEGLSDSKPATGQPGGLIGSTTYGAQGPAAAGTNAFGTGGGGLFGSHTQAKPGGLFGAGANASGGLFENNNQAGNGASGLFGAGPTGADAAAGGGELFGALTLSASQKAGAAGAGVLFGESTGLSSFGQGVNLAHQRLDQLEILAQGVARLAEAMESLAMVPRLLSFSGAVAGRTSSKIGASLGHQLIKGREPRLRTGGSGRSRESSPLRPTPRSSGKTLRYRSATPSLGLFSGTASDGAGTAGEGTPGVSGTVGVREVSVLSSSPAAQRIGSPSIFRALSNESIELPSQATTVQSNVKRLTLTDGDAASNARPPSAGRSMLGNSLDGPARDVARRADTLPPGRGVKVSRAFEAGSAAQARGADVGRSMLDNSPSSGNITGRRLFGDHTLASSSAADPNEGETDSLPGGYKMSPTLAELRRMTKTELRTVHDFTVSRPGFGSVRFLPPVDLSEVPNLSSIAGGIVQIRFKECFVYPGKEECLPGTDGMITGYTPGPKAAPGQALNVTAVISLDKCWALERETRHPIKDPDHPRYKQHISKLEEKADAEFLGFHAGTGSWQFQVKHFSCYGIHEDEAED